MSALRVVGLRKRRGGRVVLERLQLEVRAGETVAVVGENGCGKSTLLEIVAGCLPADGGEVVIGGHPLSSARAAALAMLGYAPDRPDFPESMRVDEWLALVASLKRAEIPTSALEDFGVAELRGRRLAALSLGQARRVSLLGAALGRPPLWVLDEPTNGLDAEALDALIDRLRRRALSGGANLVATHDRAFAAAIGARIVALEPNPARAANA